MTGTFRLLAKSSAARALATTRFESSGFAGIVATSMSRWPRCMSIVTIAVFSGFSSNWRYKPPTRLARSTSSTLFISMARSARLLQGMRARERLDLHAIPVDAHHRRHPRNVALEVAGGADHLPREADVGDGRRVAVAELAGLALAQMAFDRLERLQAPVRQPLVAGGFIDLQLFLHIVSYPGNDERMSIRRSDEGQSAHARPAARVLRQERRLRLGLIQVFHDRNRLEQRRPAAVEHQRWDQRLGVHPEIVLLVLHALQQIDGDFLDLDAFEPERDFHTVGREGTPEAVEFHEDLGMTGRRR